MRASYIEQETDSYKAIRESICDCQATEDEMQKRYKAVVHFSSPFLPILGAEPATWTLAILVATPPASVPKGEPASAEGLIPPPKQG
jgi:hypothetical protein